MIIEKKTWPEHFQMILDNKKKLDVRIDDFKVNEGDIICFKEWNPKIKEYTGRKVNKKISFILKTKDCSY